MLITLGNVKQLFTHGWSTSYLPAISNIVFFPNNTVGLSLQLTTGKKEVLNIVISCLGVLSMWLNISEVISHHLPESSCPLLYYIFLWFQCLRYVFMKMHNSEPYHLN